MRAFINQGLIVFETPTGDEGGVLVAFCCNTSHVIKGKLIFSSSGHFDNSVYDDNFKTTQRRIRSDNKNGHYDPGFGCRRSGSLLITHGYTAQLQIWVVYQLVSRSAAAARLIFSLFPFPAAYLLPTPYPINPYNNGFDLLVDYLSLNNISSPPCRVNIIQVPLSLRTYSDHGGIKNKKMGDKTPPFFVWNLPFFQVFSVI